MLDLEGEGFKGVKTFWLWNELTFLMLYNHSYLSFQPLGSHNPFATFGESQSIQENQLLNATVRASCYHPCRVTIFCQRTHVGLKSKQTHSVNELQKNRLFQNLEDWLTPMPCSEYYTPQKQVKERMFLFTPHSGSTIT